MFSLVPCVIVLWQIIFESKILMGVFHTEFRFSRWLFLFWVVRICWNMVHIVMSWFGWHWLADLRCMKYPMCWSSQWYELLFSPNSNVFGLRWCTTCMFLSQTINFFEINHMIGTLTLEKDPIIFWNRIGEFLFKCSVAWQTQSWIKAVCHGFKISVGRPECYCKNSIKQGY